MTTEINLAALPVTRFDVRETEDGNEIRFFSKRVKVGAFGEDEVVREDWEAALAEFIKANPTAVYAQVEDFLMSDAEDDGDEDEGDEEPGSIVPVKYRIIYGADQNCHDDVAQVLTAFVTLGRANKKNPDGGLDRAKLRAVAEINGIADKLAQWEGRMLNGGLLRMNTSNVLRGMIRRGEQVIIGNTIWEANPALMEERIARRKAARKAKKSA